MVRVRYGVVNESSACYPVGMVVEAVMKPPGELLDILKQDACFDLFNPPEKESEPGQLIVRPPILESDGSFRMIWGFHYRTILQGMVAHPVPMGVQTVNEVSLLPVILVTVATPEELLSAALLAEGRRNDYRWDEIDRIFRMAGEIDESGGASTIYHAVDDRRDVSELLTRYRRLPGVLQKPLSDGLIDIRTAELVPETLLSRWSQLFGLTEGVSFSERRQIIRLVADFVRSGRMRAEDVPAEFSGMSGSGILGMLRRRRYPTALRLDEELQSFRNRHLRGKGITVSFPANYEGDYLEFAFRARSGRELQQHIRSLQTVEAQVNELVELLLADN